MGWGVGVVMRCWLGKKQKTVPPGHTKNMNTELWIRKCIHHSCEFQDHVQAHLPTLFLQDWVTLPAPSSQNVWSLYTLTVRRLEGCQATAGRGEQGMLSPTVPAATQVSEGMFQSWCKPYAHWSCSSSAWNSGGRHRRTILACCQ